MRLVGRRALVTGASRGIGAAVAEMLAREGADVALLARTLDPDPALEGTLRETAQRVEAAGRQAIAVKCDLADHESRVAAVSGLVELWGGIDVVVNNAAMARYERVDTTSLRHRRLLFELNVHAPLDVLAVAVPPMVDAGEGWVVNITSAAARRRPGPPFPPAALNSGLYGASKAALERATNGLAEELWGSGVRVNAIRPRAAIATPGALAHVGARGIDIPPDRYQPLEEFTADVVALCCCPVEMTGAVVVSGAGGTDS